MTQLLAGLHIVVTGGSGDIGREMARVFAARGEHVTIFDLREPEAVTDDLPPDFVAARADGRIAFAAVDVRDRNVVRETLARIAPFDVVIGNAGISQSAPFRDITDEQWARHLDVNLTGNFVLGQEAAERFIVDERPGHIIFTGSWVQEVPWPEIAAYSASKAGLQMLMKSMALELARHQIRVNVIAPGIVAAGMAKYQMDHEPQYLRRIQNIIPLGRPQTTEDVARAAAFLCSEDARYMTGTTLLVDGGTSLFQFES